MHEQHKALPRPLRYAIEERGALGGWERLFIWQKAGCTFVKTVSWQGTSFATVAHAEGMVADLRLMNAEAVASNGRSVATSPEYRVVER